MDEGKGALITKPYALMCIILMIIAAFVLAFGQRVGFSDVVKAGISGFIFALIPSLMVFGYEEAKEIRERREKIRNALEAVGSELKVNLQYLGSQRADTDINRVRLAPDRLLKDGYVGVSGAGFLALLSLQQQQAISAIYHKISRIEMFSDYAVLFLATNKAESSYMSQQIALIENALRKDIPGCIDKIDHWLKAL